MTTATQLPPRQMICTKTFVHIMRAWLSGKRRIFLEGGTNSSKTYSAMQFLKLTLENCKTPLLATVTSESMPHLKRGAIRDFVKIMDTDFNEECWNRSDMIYTWPNNGCKLEFVSGDVPGKFAGPRRDIWYANELNNLHRDVYREADLRTTRFTMGDWNPYSEFWVHDEGVLTEPGNVFVGGLTYHDTPEIVSQSVIDVIESYKDKDPNYYRVHALGLLGKLEGLVYPNFKQVEYLPDGFVFYGLDFGFAVDPVAVVKNVIVGDSLYSQEVMYDRNSLTNDEIARELILRGVRKEPVYADPNEPKSIAELRKYGINMQESVKGKGSVAFGIQRVNQYYQHWTSGSLNAIKEQRNYRYLEDKDHPGRFTDKTTHQWSHLMDARRYAVASLKAGSSGSSPPPTDYLAPRKESENILELLRGMNRDTK